MPAIRCKATAEVIAWSPGMAAAAAHLGVSRATLTWSVCPVRRNLLNFSAAVDIVERLPEPCARRQQAVQYQRDTPLQVPASPA